MKKKKPKEIEYEESSGNVFADLGLSNPEEALAKSQLAWEISRIIKRKKLTQTKVAKILKIDQSKDFPKRRLFSWIRRRLLSTT